MLMGGYGKKPNSAIGVYQIFVAQGFVYNVANKFRQNKRVVLEKVARNKVVGKLAHFCLYNGVVVADNSRKGVS